MRIIIAGSRTATAADVEEATARCEWLGFASAVVSGTAHGADEHGEKWAGRNDVSIVRVPADWAKLGRRAGPVRNALMAENAEGLVAIWDGRSKGTKSMIDVARKKGLRVFVFRTDLRNVEDFAPTGSMRELWEAAEERAAIMEHDGAQPRRMAERLAGAAQMASNGK